VLPRLSPQGAGKFATTPHRSRLLQRPGLSTRAARFSGPGYAGLVASRLETQLKALPAKPGVYLFRDKGGEVL
jgi:hypothetical protein